MGVTFHVVILERRVDSAHKFGELDMTASRRFVRP
jgi:hypothetical protein